MARAAGGQGRLTREHDMARRAWANRLFWCRRLLNLRAAAAVTALLLTGCGTPFQSEERVTLTAPLPAQKLMVQTQFGDIVVEARSDAREIRAEIVKTGRGATLADAQKALAAIEVHLGPADDAPGTVLAAAHHPKGNNCRSYGVTWHITAPPDLILEATSDFGEITASGCRHGVTLKSAFGDVRAKAAGPIDAHTAFGEIRLEVLGGEVGDVVAHTDFGDVDVSVPAGRNGRLTAATDFGSLDLRLQGRTLRLIGQHEHQFEADLGGEETPRLDLATNFGDVQIHWIGKE
jgi:hypothetical protein